MTVKDNEEKIKENTIKIDNVFSKIRSYVLGIENITERLNKMGNQIGYLYKQIDLINNKKKGDKRIDK